MAGLATLACKSIDTIGFDVCDGNYDLSRPTGIILPQVWERVIEPWLGNHDVYAAFAWAI
jgi:hypothetical protein